MKYECKVHNVTFDSALEYALHAKENAVVTYNEKFDKSLPKPTCKVISVVSTP